MNKTTQLILKAMIAKLTTSIFICICCFSCNTLEDDEKLLNLIINEGNYTEKDSIFFNNEGANTSVIDFFRYRNNKNIAFKGIFKEEANKNYKLYDTIYRKIDSVVYIEQPTKSDKYIITGKGISEITEKFLKDSFNYQDIGIKKWDLDKKTKKLFCQKKIKNSSNISISKPVYNLLKDKAIIYKAFNKGSSLETSIYFLKKTKQKWIIIYQETNHSL